MTNKQISILGTGWLGLPLAKELLNKGYTVKGSTTTAERSEHLRTEGIEPYLIQVEPEGITGNIADFLSGTEVLVVDIPPGLRKDPKKQFSEAIQKLAVEVEKSGVKKVLFVSSISVYEETESFPIYTEDTEPNATSAAGRELAASEEILLKNAIFDTTVLRFGGLIGAGRHPVKYLAGRSGLSNPLGPVNLIHQRDCIGIIEKILEKDIFGEVFNAVYPVNPPREKYYQQKASEAGLEIPLFEHSENSEGKIISASKVMRELEYGFKVPI
ncbi:NAD(P)H-binding protein [Salinimicrobium soli]|uniref:NAD(P)H-binding protein n=1 Tax=Salinimicrobium soli TaxID=1254399 RepID=UPI003AADF6C4